MEKESKSSSEKGKNAFTKNWKAFTVAAVILIAILVFIFTPFLTVPVMATETYYTSELQKVPVTETIITKESYTELTAKEQVIYQDALINVDANKYTMLASSFDLSNKTDVMLKVKFESLDRRAFRFLIFNQLPYEVYPFVFTPPPIYTNRDGIGSFALGATTNEYYFIFDNQTFVSTRLIKFTASVSWLETTVKYRDVTSTQTVFKETMVQVPRQREVIKDEKKSLFWLLSH